MSAPVSSSPAKNGRSDSSASRNATWAWILGRGEGGVDVLGDRAGDRADEERDVLGAKLSGDERDQQRRHQRPLRVVKEVPVAPVGFGARLGTQARVVVEHLFDHRAGFGQRVSLVLHHREPAARVNGSGAVRRAHRLGVSGVRLELVVQLELLEEPKHAVGTRGLEVVHDDGHAPDVAASGAAGISPRALVMFAALPRRWPVGGIAAGKDGPASKGVRQSTVRVVQSG